MYTIWSYHIYMTNPYKARREELGQSQVVLSVAAGLSRHYVTRVEQGLYFTPSPKLATALHKKHNVLLEEYHNWQKLSRARNHAPVADGIMKYLDSVQFPRPGKHPHVALRTCIAPSQIGFCVLLKVQPSRVNAYESGDSVLLPAFLKEAYIDCGIPISTLSEVEDRLRGSATGR